MKNRLDTHLESFRKKELRTLSRFISAAENQDPEMLAVMKGLHRESQSPVIGFTGPPGAGKSSICNAYVAYLRKMDQSVAVIAVDPMSPFTGGALLGDRIRLQDHFNDPKVFIRSLSTRGKLGGLSLAARQVIHLCLFFGFDRCLIETVGVGQNEVDIRSMADLTVVVLVPEWGDSVQALKAGLLEIGDIFLVHKADREGAERVTSELRGMLEIQGRGECVILESSIQNRDSLEAVFEACEEFLTKNSERIKKRRLSWAKLTAEELMDSYLRRECREWMKSVAIPEENPYAFMEKFLKRYPPGKFFL